MYDLALALGMTVSDIHNRMSNAELSGWAAYVEENGPLNPMLRMESAMARSVSLFLKNAKPSDLMLWPKSKQEDIEGTVENVASLLGVVHKVNKK